MATIYYCKICEKLIVDEDELPTVGVYCSKGCEKLHDKYGAVKGKEEHKKKKQSLRRPPSAVETRNLPAESIPENNVTPRKSLKKKKSQVGEDDRILSTTARASFLTQIFGKKDNSDSDNETSSGDSKKTNKNIVRPGSSGDYDDSMEYFKKQSEIERSLKNITINQQEERSKDPNKEQDVSTRSIRNTTAPTEQISRDVSTRSIRNTTAPTEQISRDVSTRSIRNTTATTEQISQDVSTRSIRNTTATTEQTSIPRVENPTPAAPISHVDSPLGDFNDFDSLEPPPPSYDTLFPPSQTAKAGEETPLPPLPPEKEIIKIIKKNKEKETIKKNDNKEKGANKKNDNKEKETNKKNDNKEKEPTTADINTNKNKPPVPPKVNITAPKVPPKVPIPAIQPPLNQQPFHNSNQNSNSYQQFQQFQQYQQPYYNPADTFLQEQATLPPTVYPPPFYTMRGNNRT